MERRRRGRGSIRPEEGRQDQRAPDHRLPMRAVRQKAWAGVIVGLGLVAAQAGAQDYALSLHLPKGGALGFYRIGEGQSWGLETALRLQAGSHSGSYPLSPVARKSVYTNLDSLGVSLGFVYQKNAGSGPVTPFLFAGLGGGLGWSGRDSRNKASEQSWELAIGVGAAWRPFDSVSLWVRQGVAMAREIDDSLSAEGVDIHRDVTLLRMNPLDVLAVWMW